MTQSRASKHDHPFWGCIQFPLIVLKVS